MGTYTLLIALVTTGLLLASRADAHQRPGALHWGKAKSILVDWRTVKRIRERKCRSVPEKPRRGVLAHIRSHDHLYRVQVGWKRSLRSSRQLERRCSLPANMLRSYRAIPAWRQAAWQAIHSCEGSWTDTGDPYWGGLQMDWAFMRTYGADALRFYNGPASSWPWYVQVVVADRAYRSGRGFYPWPACARLKGLI